MTVRERLNAADLRRVITTFRDALVQHKESINALNVYPVPDGDTGTNMSLTLESVVKELDDDMDMENTAGAISHGSLMGARGNSGVILSQIMRGLTDRLKTVPEISASDLADALASAAKAAYGAVLKPVEGTILTVVREVAEAGERIIGSGDDNSDDLVALLEQLREEGYESLERTPTLLPVLADAGVVDAGGRGFLLLIDSLLHVIDGRPLPEPDTVVAADLAAITAGAATTAPADGEKNIADLRYEVMYFLDAEDSKIESFKHAWGEMGDSIVVVGGDGIWNCHIHTDHIGASIEAGIAVGRPHGIRVTDLLEELEHIESLHAAPALSGVVVNENADSVTGVVAVGVGSGVASIFASLGANAMVVGGQTMNPSTELLLEAVDQVASDHVVILPNNKNIIAVAEQVNAQTSKTVEVVPTRSVAEGFAALMAFEPGSELSTNSGSMTAAAEAITCGEITCAVRDSQSDAGPITTGDWLGLNQGRIAVVSGSLSDAGAALLDSMIDDDHELVTLICGEDATPEVTDSLEAWIGEHHPDVEVEIHQGGQPLYPYYVGIE